MNISVILWLAVALIAGIAEAATVALVSVWLAVGAVCAAVAAGIGLNSAVQCIVFLVVSLILLFLTAPMSKKFRRSAKTPTNADRLIGCEGVVIEDIDPIQGKGEVKVKGQIWSAAARGEGFVKAGAHVTVEEISGAHLVVSVKE